MLDVPCEHKLRDFRRLKHILLRGTQEAGAPAPVVPAGGIWWDVVDWQVVSERDDDALPG